MGSFTGFMREFSRRHFLKSAATLGAASALYGCSSGSSEDVMYMGQQDDGFTSEDIYYSKNPVYRYGTTAHNCGGRCISRAQVTDNRRIVRFLADETEYAYDGSSIDKDSRNNTIFRPCARCRSYKWRLYHPGRLKYPLKQTKERGDMSGFERITWKQALKEITERREAIQNKYGREAAYNIYAYGNCASTYQGTDLFFEDRSPFIGMLGGVGSFVADYSFHQASYMGAYIGDYGLGTYTGRINMAPNADDAAGVCKYIVLWGANTVTTSNHRAQPWVKGIEDMKKRDPESKVLFIGPELSETAIAVADEWIQIRPFTDVALVLAMIYEMIINTFDSNGKIRTDIEPWLDVNYLDTLVYGFFDSPGYWLNLTSGVFDLDTPAPAASDVKTVERADGHKWSWISPVPDGRSLSSYIMGNDPRLTLASYGSDNYVAKSFTDKITGIKRNKSVCQYPAPSNTKFEYKKHFNQPKSAEWASAITGISAQRIRDLAALYVDAVKSGNSLWNEWAGGMLKQAEGCSNLYAIECLNIVVKNWGITGTGIAHNILSNSIGRTKELDPNQIDSKFFYPPSWATGALPVMRVHPRPSVTQWHNGIKYAFGDQLKANGYSPNIPGWKGLGTGSAYYDDGGVKSLLRRSMSNLNTSGKLEADTYTVTDSNGITRTYYDYDGRGTSAPVHAGYRFVLNTCGNIPVNQHMNCIDSSEMYRHLPTYGYKDAKYNVNDMGEAFYMVCFDNFMSPSARYADYVLPAKTTWEQEDFISLKEGETLYVDSVMDGPGEALSTWDFAREWLKVAKGPEVAAKFTGDGSDTTFRQVVQKKYNSSIKTNQNSPFYGKTWDEFLEKPVSHAKPSQNATAKISRHPLRESLDKYLNGTFGPVDSTPFYAGIITMDSSLASGVISFGFDEFAETLTCPNQSKRFHVYSGSLQWRYENLFSKWHGHLSLEEQGQMKDDGEGGAIVQPIPMYYDYHDFFMEAYNLSSKAELEGRYLLTTTHDRFRSHSSMSENPILRELTHRTIGGGLYSGNDAGYYAASTNANGNCDTFSPLNSMIGADGLPMDRKIASYADIWVNNEDFADMSDGTLVLVENEIGAVYCTLRKTKRCARGYVGLHQGCWFDPREINGRVVDVGGNCNTLMASKPSRMDHGNAQQSAMVRITKVEK